MFAPRSIKWGHKNLYLKEVQIWWKREVSMEDKMAK